MQLKGKHQFSAPLDIVWDALMDPQVLGAALPGGEALEQVQEHEYKAAMNVRVGPVQGRFEGKIELADIKERESYRLSVSGKGAPGFLSGEGELFLAENAKGTQMTYAGEVQVGGRIASVGQRLLESTSRSLIRQGLKALDAILVERMQLSPGQPLPDDAGDGREPKPKQTARNRAATRRPKSGSGAQDAPSPPPKQSDSQASAESGAAPASAAATTGSDSGSAPAPDTKAAGPDMGTVAFEVAKDVTQDLVSDFIPPKQQERVFFALLGALAMLLFVILVRLVQRS